MKRIYLYSIAMLMVSALFLASCGGEAKDDTKDTVKEVVVEVNHTQSLLDQIIKNGDIINSSRVPTMTTAEAVNTSLGEKQLIIDIRPAKDFSAGFIKGAVNVQLGGLLDYFKTNDTKAFEKVVMVCHTGQTASYATSILQMMGYENVYAMKWGMASWNKKFADKWLEGASDKLATQLETTLNEKGAKTDLPKIECAKEDGASILEARASMLLKDGFKPALITVDEVMADPANYYIINYWPEALYSLGHLPGAKQYNPKKSLKTDADLLTVPTDKTVVVYCFTGQHSAFVTAYLRILGYDAKSLKFGANGFMNKMMIDNEDIGHGFNAKQIKNYKFETQKYEAPAEGTVVEEGGC